MAKAYFIAGHGAGDPGAGKDGRWEADDVRRLCAKIKERGGSNVEILDTSRNWYKDNGISKLSLPKGATLTELHRDSDSGTARGAHVIIKDGFNADAVDNALAKKLSAIFPGRSSIIVKRSNLANVNRAAARGINYRLCEVGFVDNVTDNKIFDGNLAKIADAILEACGVKPSSSPAPTPAPKPAPAPAPKPAAKDYGGTYRVNCGTLNVRDAMGTSANVVARYHRGQTVVLDNWRGSKDGYIWGRYTGASSGKKRFVAIGPYTGCVDPKRDYLLKV